MDIEENITKEYEIIFNNNNKLIIKLSNNEILFILVTNFSYYNYIKKYQKYELIKELEIEDNIAEELDSYLKNSIYTISFDY